MTTLLITNPILILTFVALFGLCVGSFLNVVIYRLPLEQSVVKPRSFCPHCQHPIAWYDNVPVFSFLLLRRRCRYCHKSISIQYVVVEILTGVLSVATLFYFQNWLLYFVWFCLFMAPLLAVIFIDLQHRIIPDAISLPGIGAGILVHYLTSLPLFGKQALLESALGILVGGGFLFLVAWGYEKLKKKEGLGGGDVKLAAMLGAFFGWQAILMILLIASVFGTLVGLVVILIKKNWQYALPFGPFLVFAAYLQLFYGSQILNWYLSLLH